MLNNLISAISTLAKQIQANQQGIKYVAKTAGAASKFYKQVAKPSVLEEMGEYYQKLEIEKRQEWLLKTGKDWKRMPF
jgi:hypothetical protein